MLIYIDFPTVLNTFRISLGILSPLFFFVAVAILAMLIRQKQYRSLLIAVPLLCLSYFLEQCFAVYMSAYFNIETSGRFLERFFSLPDWVLLSFFLILAAMELLMLQKIYRHKNERITGMSVKEAMDSLPDGICCYVPEGRVILANHAMEEFVGKATGEEHLYSDDTIRALLSGQLREGCSMMKIGDETIVVLEDGTAGKTVIQDIPYEKYMVRMLVVNDITEAYRKMAELQHIQKKVEILGKRLADVNREIVSLTAEREILNARIRIHDEMGSTLLAVKHYIKNGGSKQELSELTDRLRRSVSFLRNDLPAPVRDEYELMIETAAQLGVSVLINGTLPQSEPYKHILATAIHECFTNTLRHAHGNELRITIREDDKKIEAVFSNNGDQPGKDITEKGGLASLRTLTEQAGGKMTVCCDPSFAVILELPKEEKYVL